MVHSASSSAASICAVPEVHVSGAPLRDRLEAFPLVTGVCEVSLRQWDDAHARHLKHRDGALV